MRQALYFSNPPSKLGYIEVVIYIWILWQTYLNVIGCVSAQGYAIWMTSKWQQRDTENATSDK